MTMKELILMKCNECGATKNYFDERMGERICNDCGLVLVQEIFEQNVHILNKTGDVVHSADNGKLGSVISGKGSFKFNKFGKNSVTPKNVQNGLMHCNMTLAAIAPQMNLGERVEKIYLELYTAKKMANYSYEERGAAIVHYALKENGTPYTFKEICFEFDCNKTRVMRLTRKINQHYGNRILKQTNPSFSLQRVLNLITDDNVFYLQARQVLERIEPVLNRAEHNRAQSYFAAVCWITANVFVRNDITSVLISEKTGFRRWNIHKETKKIISLLGFDTVKEMKGKDINFIGE